MAARSANICAQHRRISARRSSRFCFVLDAPPWKSVVLATAAFGFACGPGAARAWPARETRDEPSPGADGAREGGAHLQQREQLLNLRPDQIGVGVRARADGAADRHDLVHGRRVDALE
jgi:hypothetical protein